MIKRGFTLIELLIVITIIGILTAVVTTNLQAARSRARDTRRKSDLRAIEQAVRLYYNDAKSFPASNDGQIVGCNTLSAPSPCAWGTAFATNQNTYMGSLPLDPASTANSTITYRYISSGSDNYYIVASLENLSDSDIGDSQARCSGYSGDITKDFVICAQ